MGAFAAIRPFLPVQDDEDEDGGFARGLRPEDDPATVKTAMAPPPPNDDDGEAVAPLKAPVYLPPDRTELERSQGRLQADSAPLNRADYKPTWKERLAAGLGAAAIGFGGDTGTAIRAGQGVVNRRWDEAQAAQQQRVTADQAGVSAARAGLQDQDRDYERQLQAFNAQDRALQIQGQYQARMDRNKRENEAAVPGSEQPVDPKNPLGAWTATAKNGSTLQLGGPPASWAKSPAGIAAQREADVARLGLKGDQAMFYRANGKLHEPVPSTNIHVPSAESEELHAYLGTLGHKPTAADILNFKHPSQSGKADGETVTPTQWQGLLRERQKAYDSAQKEKTSRLAAAQGVPELQKQINDEYVGRAHDLQNEWNGRLSAADPTGKYAQKPTQQASASQPAQPVRNAAPQSRTVIGADGQQHKVEVRSGKWVYSDTGKPLA